MCPHNQRTVLLAGPAEVGHWFGHDDLWCELFPEATEEGVADGMGLLVLDCG